jgi:enamine deaminase RidA (YjgF/YER057c/UK114 family)
MKTGKPMANYASARRAGDFVFVSGVVAVDPSRRAVLQSYDELPAQAAASLQALGYCTGQMTLVLLRTITSPGFKYSTMSWN